MEAQNAPIPTGQLAAPTWRNRAFLDWFCTEPYGDFFRFLRKTPPPVQEKTFRRHQNHGFSKSTHILIEQKRFERKTSSQLWERRFWKWPGRISVKYVCGDFRQNPKNRSFFELRQDFWFKSFSLDQKYIVLYENIWYLVITRHCSSLCSFSSFSAFLGKRKNRGKFPKIRSRDEQWRSMTRNHIFW